MFYRHLIPNAQRLSEGKALHFKVNQSEFVIIKQQGELRAYENRCPHQKRALNCHTEEIFDDDGDYIKCHHHGALFSPNDGQCIAGPCQGKTLKKATLGVEKGNFYIVIGEGSPAVA